MFTSANEWTSSTLPTNPRFIRSLLRGCTLAGFYRRLMVIHDWICGEASQAGQPSGYLERRPDFRTVAREAAAFGESNLKLLSSEGVGKLLDIDPQALNRQIANLDDAGQAELLVQAMAPS